MSKAQSCCVTGHRDIPLEKIPYVQDQLHQELVQAIQHGYTHFISGFASGMDLIFAGIVAGLKSEYPITLEAAIPYPGRMKSPDRTLLPTGEKTSQRLVGGFQWCSPHRSKTFRRFVTNGSYPVVVSQRAFKPQEVK